MPGTDLAALLDLIEETCFAVSIDGTRDHLTGSFAEPQSSCCGDRKWTGPGVNSMGARWPAFCSEKDSISVDRAARGSQAGAARAAPPRL
jgi:hypothetical protein